MPLRLSLLDLALVRHGQPVAEALAESTALAQHADRLGRFERLWFAEHHNMASIASAATSVLIAHIAASTSTLRVGAGGIMLPNHSPLVIAEQFGTLESLHAGRIDLGLGRAPGTDQRTWAALRRDPAASDRFPQDVVELAGLLGWQSGPREVSGHSGRLRAIPGEGTRVPLFILGSSLFGAQLAAYLGLPYAFASHFAPDALLDAMQVYRERFQPSEQCAQPYAIAALNVIASRTVSEAETLHAKVIRARVRSFARRLPNVPELSDSELADAVTGPLGDQARHMTHYTAVGDEAAVSRYLRDFQELSGADELMVTNPAPGQDNRERTLEILARSSEGLLRLRDHASRRRGWCGALEGLVEPGAQQGAGERQLGAARDRPGVAAEAKEAGAVQEAAVVAAGDRGPGRGSGLRGIHRAGGGRGDDGVL